MTELSCHCEAERSEAVAIAKSLELNGITTSCAAHTPRNDKNFGSFCKVMDDKSHFHRPQGRGIKGEGLLHRPDCKILKQVQDDKYVSEAHRKELNVLKSYRLNDFKKKAAFTLAEVLITLGIIGIVAAMTIPTLIANYQKKVTATKLKQTYSILSQALKMAQAEHGDPNTWSIAGVKGSSAMDESRREEIVNNFMGTYVKPYIKVVKDFGYKTYLEHGYDGPNFPNGTLCASEQNTSGDAFVLQNGVWVMGLISTTGCLKRDPNDPDVCLERNFDNVLFVTDINGADNPPNAFGKDVFYIYFDNTKPSVTMVAGTGLTRDDYLQRCAEGGSSVSSGNKRRLPVALGSRVSFVIDFLHMLHGNMCVDLRI